MSNSRFKPSFKPSLPDTIRANNKAMEFYSAMSGKPTPDGAMREVKEKGVRRHGMSEIPLEKDIQKAIIHFLSAHPKISIYGRFNSGTAITGDAQGNTRYTRFNSIKGFPDIHGMLKGGRAVYIEVKRPGGRVSEEQQEFIDKVSAHGAVAFVAYSVDDVIQNFKRLGV